MGEMIQGRTGKWAKRPGDETTRGERESGRNDSGANGKVGETIQIRAHRSMTGRMNCNLGIPGIIIFHQTIFTLVDSHQEFAPGRFFPTGIFGNIFQNKLILDPIQRLYTHLKRDDRRTS